MEIRNADANDVDALDAALLAAFNWEPTREPLPLEHPAMAAYRDPLFGVVAEEAGAAVGAAYCVLAPTGYGFVDDATPEVTIGVAEGRRGSGVGTKLLEALHDRARELGYGQLSLSVEPHNPALRLYERAGYREVGVDEGGSITMVSELR